MSKYGENIKTIFDKKVSDIDNILLNHPDSEIAYNVNINLVRVNNKNKADFSFYASNNSNDTNVKYVNRYLDLNQTHSLTHHKIVEIVDETIKKSK